MTLSRKSLTAILVTVLLWGSAYPGIRAGLSAYSPGELTLLRYLTASTTLAVCASVQPFRLPRWRDVPGLVALGALGFTIFHLALNYGEQTVTAGAASFLAATSPIFATLLASWFLDEQLTSWGWLGIALSLSGIALIALGEADGFGLDAGALLILLSAMSGAGYFTLQKSFLRRYSPLELTTYAVWAGTLLMGYFLPGLADQVTHASWDATLAVVYIGIFPGALAYVTYAYVLAQLPVSVTTSFLYLVPVMTLPIAWLWLGEVPAQLAVIGGLIALAGVVIVQRKGKNRKPKTAAAP